MEGSPTMNPSLSPSNSQPLFGDSPDPSVPNSTNEAFPTKPEEQVASKESASWPALPGTSKTPLDSPIPAGQKSVVQTTPASWMIHKSGGI